DSRCPEALRKMPPDRLSAGSSERSLDYVAEIDRDIASILHGQQCMARMRLPPRLQRAPRTECRSKPCGQLRVAPVYVRDGRRDKAIAFAISRMKTCLVGVGQRTDQGTYTVRVGYRKGRMACKRLYPLDCPRAWCGCLDLEPFVHSQRVTGMALLKSIECGICLERAVMMPEQRGKRGRSVRHVGSAVEVRSRQSGALRQHHQMVEQGDTQGAPTGACRIGAEIATVGQIVIELPEMLLAADAISRASATRAARIASGSISLPSSRAMSASEGRV